MPNHSKVAIDVASYPEYENVVAEIAVGSELTIVVSKEPGESDFSIAFYGNAGSTNAPSYARPTDSNRLLLSDVLEGIERGRLALDGQ